MPVKPGDLDCLKLALGARVRFEQQFRVSPPSIIQSDFKFLRKPGFWDGFREVRSSPGIPAVSRVLGFGIVQAIENKS
jgi:hypothetical protein